MPKLLTVFGATGNQGGSIIEAVLSDATLREEFTIRGITRDISKPAARALAARGIEVVAADMDSKDSVLQAVTGSHTVFLVTTPDFTGGDSKELVHGKNVTDACQETGVQHLIFSSLLHVTDTTNGRLTHVPHFDMKAEVERYIRSKDIPSTFLLPGYFMSNYTALQLIRKGDNGEYTLAYPVSDKAMFPLIDIEADMGKYVIASIKQREDVLGKQILAAADYYTPARMLAEFEEVTGGKTNFVKLDADTFKSFFPSPMGVEMLENHLFIEEPGYYAGKSLSESLDLLNKVGLKPTTFKEFLVKNKAAF
ncbi:uncharacterized protein TrAFT101_000125 [Trichoderma asperellum]|uniref:NmrA-like domain-containing protein n=1 Tax=Trichoderma asperellum (strain ATCC 204424 / CBS 433.97 / NBRC 101777) TaxID=1042311 RepID=A0A2T3YUE8_TRIA4|nr:hypothetical protein M441DRAFT_40785 [Trichoderma asperellum CBS 433.97]PTB36159.1 hypothetical protein M441DRAFT_40785 [Trichoderma asperellum CBS 433.97]UKZ84210.1 hypothetical protein TrAFT101_000125 [Trichoderma asperellum]